VINFKTGIDCIKWSQLFQLYDKVGLVAGLAKSREYDKIKDSFVRSYKVVTAWDGETLVGAGRLLSDGICYGMIFDLGVLPEYQRRGLVEAYWINYFRIMIICEFILHPPLGTKIFIGKMDLNNIKLLLQNIPLILNT